MTDGQKNIDPLVERVARFIDDRKLIAPGGRVVIGVSGGCDSVAALAILQTLACQPDRRYELTVAHLDHALRDESPEDAVFVGQLARRWGMRCVTERIDVGALARERSLSIETAARLARYDFLQRTAQQADAEYVAVAHHSDDNAETICHRIFRGSHLRGASGIRASRTMGDSGVLLVRPMLNCRRAEIEAFCQRENLTWRTDPTNAQNDYTRNFIRNELLPLAKSRINPEGDMALVRLAEAISEAEDYIAQDAQKIAAKCIALDHNGAITIDTRPLRDVARVLRRWVLREAIQRAGVSMRKVSSVKLEEMASLVDGDQPTVNLPDDYLARYRNQAITITPAALPEQPHQAPITLPTCGQITGPSGAEITCTPMEFDADLVAAHCGGHKRGVELLDADKIQGPLICRTRANGDKFAPLGLNGRQSVSDFLTNAALDDQARDKVRCICDDEGIIYLAPLRIDQRVKISQDTTRILRIEFNSDPTQ
ncbi:MAG: tRNA lysidine(34) synthetase TilS [Phycisphaerales bacterium]|jgi:tRNA(Ile)-lysidine synthase|nr:tRNA lysidine(34) synthetase TilS [Phycisphaerales bacterium]